MFGLMSRRPMTDPSLLIPLLTLAGAMLSEKQQVSSSVCQLTSAGGDLILVKPSLAFVIHPSTVRVGINQVTRIQVLGLSQPLDVRESIRVVVSKLGGNWVNLHVPGSWLDLGSGVVQVLVAPSHVISVEPSTYRLNKMNRPLTDVFMVQGYRLQVIEDVSTVARLFGR